MYRMDGNRGMQRAGLVVIGLMGLLLLVAIVLKMGRLTTNPRSRVITVERLVDADTWAHIQPGDTTPFELSIDMVCEGERCYSSKPPTYPLLMAGEAKAIKAVTGWEVYAQRVNYVRILVLLNQVLPYLLALWMAFQFLLRHTERPFVVFFMLLALGPGMLAFGYAATVNNHTPAAALYLISFFLALRYREASGARRRGIALLVGLLCGFALANELPSGLIALWLLALLFLEDWRRALWAVPAFCFPILLGFYLYHFISGSWTPFYLRPELYHYAGSYWNDPEGIDAVRPQKGEYLFHMLLGFRGLFSMTPLLALGLVAFVRGSLGGRAFFRREFGGILLGAGALVFFVVFRTWNYGGDCIGMRWFICFSPLLMLMALPLVEDLSRRLWGRALLLLLLAWGIPWVMEAAFEEAFIVGTFDRLWGFG